MQRFLVVVWRIFHANWTLDFNSSNLVPFMENMIWFYSTLRRIIIHVHGNINQNTISNVKLSYWYAFLICCRNNLAKFYSKVNLKIKKSMKALKFGSVLRSRHVHENSWVLFLERWLPSRHYLSLPASLENWRRIRRQTNFIIYCTSITTSGTFRPVVILCHQTSRRMTDSWQILE